MWKAAEDISYAMREGCGDLENDEIWIVAR